MTIIKVIKVERTINWGAKDPKTGELKPLYDNCKTQKDRTGYPARQIY